VDKQISGNTKKEKAPIPLRELGLDGSHGLCGDQEK
jgi:hypothetical protein